MSPESPSYEDEILRSIGEGNDSEGTETQDTEVPATETQYVAETPPTSNDSDATKQGTEAKQETQQTGGPTDLKDTQGAVVAKGGADRRHYENWQKSARENEGLKQQLSTLNAQNEAFHQSGGLGQQYSLSPEELTSGAQIMSAWKSDPAGTAKYMLTQAQALGHNIEGIGGTDVEAIKAMVQQAVAPLVQEHQQRVDTQNQRSAAETEYNQFTATYPDGPTHAESLARLLESDSNLSLEAAYFKLKSFYLEKGLDWSKPLEVLQKEAASRGIPTAQPAQRQLPSGNVNGQNVTDTSEVASANTSFDDIIKQSMQDAGFRYN